MILTKCSIIHVRGGQKRMVREEEEGKTYLAVRVAEVREV